MAFALERLETIVARRSASYGNKARALAQLARAGFPVPPAYAIGADTCENFLRSNLSAADLPGALMISGSATPRHLERIRAQIAAAPLSWEIDNGIRRALDQLRSAGVESFAVRSSAEHEDEFEFSAAGLHESYLNLRDDESAIAAIKKCWSSLFQDALFTYLEKKGKVISPGIGVVVQAMVDAEVSGVMMTSNPLTGDADQVVIAANYGLGTSVVGGDAPVDHIRVNKHTGQLIDQINATKTVADTFAAEGGIERNEVSESQRSMPALNPGHIELLRRLALRIEQQFQSAQDVEWAFSEGALYVLQSRPMRTVTDLYANIEKASDEKQVPSDVIWTRANVGEALPGVATPLSWSVMSRFSELGFRRLFGAFGCKIPNHARFVGEFRGRIYLNLSAVLGVLQQLPNVDLSLLTELGGGLDPTQFLPAVSTQRNSIWSAKLPAMILRATRTNIALHRDLASFEPLYAREKNRIAQNDLRVLSPLGLSQVLRHTERLLDLTGATMLTIYGRLLVALMLLRLLAQKHNATNASALVRDLLSALSQIEGAQMVEEMRAIADLLPNDEGARKAIETRSAMHVEDLPAGPVRDALQVFLKRYGHRGVREAEIAEPRWSEDISTLLISISLLAKKRTSIEQAAAQTQVLLDRRKGAEEQLLSVTNWALRPAVQQILQEVATAIRKREVFRSRVVEVLSLYRRVALEISKRMHDADPGSGSDAAFYLSVEELMGWLDNPHAMIATQVAYRKKQHARYQQMHDPPATFVNRPPSTDSVVPNAKVFQGLGVCAGAVEGRARVIRSLDQVRELDPEEILVTSVVDVGWAPLFAGCRGVVSELGGPLSHAGVILRELGIPAVFNLPSATQVLQTGELIRIDGSSGTVEKINSTPS